ncbi:MAG: reactive intermediate/imine deaminase [Kangiella sp.]|nr:MAG: reactive intermediate/imine deaminase [Kangiella sp.]
MTKSIISTSNAPEAIGTYSQAVKHGDCLYVSGQIPLDPKTMIFVSDDIDDQIHQVFKNLRAICEAADTSLNQIIKLNIFLTDLSCFPMVNQIMAEYFELPYPARAAVGVKELPKGALVEMDAIVGLS